MEIAGSRLPAPKMRRFHDGLPVIPRETAHHTFQGLRRSRLGEFPLFLLAKTLQLNVLYACLKTTTQWRPFQIKFRSIEATFIEIWFILFTYRIILILLPCAATWEHAPLATILRKAATIGYDPRWSQLHSFATRCSCQGPLQERQVFGLRGNRGPR